MQAKRFESQHTNFVLGFDTQFFSLKLSLVLSEIINGRLVACTDSGFKVVNVEILLNTVLNTEFKILLKYSS